MPRLVKDQDGKAKRSSRQPAGPDLGSAAGQGRLLFNRYSLPLEAELHRLVPATDTSLLGRAMRHALFPPGKRIRPLLCIAAYRACRGARLRTILPFAAGIELIHNFSLIQDDLPCMDDDALRRGRPSLHVAFGEAVALLASDAMFSLAFELFAGSDASPARRSRAIQEVARSIGSQGIVEGQLNDIDRAKSRDARTLRRIHCLKTARLIAACFSVGAIIAGADGLTTGGLTRAGLFLGMLFQVTDDLLDEGQASDRAGALTYLRYYGRRGAQFRALGYRVRYEAELARLGGRITPTGLRELKQVGSLVLERHA